MTNSWQLRRPGLFALVSYIPDPVGAFVHRLREMLPSEKHPQPHITILPPRPLTAPLNVVAEHAFLILQQFSAFEVELADVRYFTGTNFLYLDIAKGRGLLHALHDALNTGDLAHDEEFEFRPHLTIAGPVHAESFFGVRERAEVALRRSTSPLEFSVEDVVFLWLDPDQPERQWQRLWTFRLNRVGSESLQRATASLTAQTY